MDQSNGSFLLPLTPDQQHLRPLIENPFEISDDWGESPNRSASTQGSPWRSRRGRSGMGQSCSAPLLHHAAGSTHASTWYSTSSDRTRSISSQGPRLWHALGSTWRDREKDEYGLPVRANCDDAKDFIDGCVPNWSKSSVRKTKALEHELTWTYYRMRRHAVHPHRKEVGDPHLPQSAVVEKMRSGTENKFQFWRDLRPPFHISGMRRDQSDPLSHHPDGDLFFVNYSCGIDYVGERLWNEKSIAGTFDNMIHGTASVRIPDGYPQKRATSVISWGSPSLNWTADEDATEGSKRSYIDPEKWMPIADELNIRADMPRLAACRQATHRAHIPRQVEVSPLQGLLLGPHASLPRLAHTADAMSRANNPASPTKGASPSPIKKKRQHRIFTAAAGFVRYAG